MCSSPQLLPSKVHLQTPKYKHISAPVKHSTHKQKKSKGREYRKEKQNVKKNIESCLLQKVDIPLFPLLFPLCFAGNGGQGEAHMLSPRG